MVVSYRQFTVKYGKLLVTLVTYKSNQNNYLSCMIQVKKGHSSIDNVIRNTPTSLDMFLHTNFDNIRDYCNENQP